ncbi:hypothetical protein [Novosphingobium sp. LASN5T]|uniref:hypothetical protein n=1 Tax=Novosphingobium sp. LASN5T TaxID=2491021 RepID=UPI000F5E6920|nr:hypothetical protein [Novosphingobium sp. LASN5T]RQW46147.1 hypothetical protein EH199_02020 [Novosphingobium sp. LASN5T]
MADRASASIVIGGTLRRSEISDLVEAIASDGGRADWEGELLDVASVRDGEALKACAHELAGGTFDWTEQFCEDHGLAYARDSGSCGGAFGPERVVFTGIGAAMQFDMTESDEIVLARTMIRELGSMEMVEAWFTQAEFTPPPFTIIEDEPAGGEINVAPVDETADG